MHPRKKALVIRLSSLGDIILTFATVRILSKNYEVHFLTKERFKQVVALESGVSKVHLLTDHSNIRQLLAKCEELSREKYDVVYDLHRNHRTFVLKWQFKVLSPDTEVHSIRKHRVLEAILFLFKRKVFKSAGLDHLLLRANEGKKLIGTSEESSNIKKFQSSVSITDDFGVLQSKPIAISIESLWAQKQWSKDKFIELARYLVAKGHKIVWLGQKPIGIIFDEIFNQGNVLDLTGKTTIDQVASVLSKCSLFIGNDSGLMHLSEYVGRPVVAVFGPTSPELGFAPQNPNSEIVQADLWCRPCSKSGNKCFRISEKQKCLSLVKTNDVFAAVEKVLSRDTA